MVDRNAIIEKIKALLAKTTANGATEAERLSALDKASAMMDAYDITDDEVQVAKDEAAILHADPPDVSDPHSLKWQFSHGVSQFCGVVIYPLAARPVSRASARRAISSLRCGYSTIWLTSFSQNSTPI